MRSHLHRDEGEKDGVTDGCAKPLVYEDFFQNALVVSVGTAALVGRGRVWDRVRFRVNRHVWSGEKVCGFGNTKRPSW